MGVSNAGTHLRTHEGWTDNYKRIYRVYTEEGLQGSKCRKRPKTQYRGQSLETPSRTHSGRWTS